MPCRSPAFPFESKASGDPSRQLGGSNGVNVRIGAAAMLQRLAATLI